MFTFETEIREGGASRQVLVLFSGQLEGDPLQYAEKIEKAFADRHRPHDVAFIVPRYLYKEIRTFLDTTSPVLGNLSRFGTKTNVTVYSFGKDGTLRREKLLKKAGARPALHVNELLIAIVRDGLLQLVEANKGEVIIPAPAGAKFMKPSGDTSTFFIQASGMARNYDEHQFVAFCLLGCAPQNIPVKKLYIDSGSIAAIAEAVCYYLYRFSDSACKDVTYTTFSSYSGLEACKPDVVDDVWVIISASASNNLGKRVAATWGLDNDQVVTLLTAAKTKGSVSGTRALSNIRKVINVDFRTLSRPQVNVKIVGENFTSEILAPRTVTLKADHMPPSLTKFIRLVAEGRSISCHRTAGFRTRSIHLDFSTLLGENKDKIQRRLSDWVERIISWYVPRKVGCLIYDLHDSNHVKLAEMVKAGMRKTGHRGSCAELHINDQFPSVQRNAAAIVLCPVIGTGSSLMRVNRELRLSEHTGNRLFIAPFAITPSSEAFKVLKNSLCFGPDGFRYQFQNYLSISCGSNSAEDSWDREWDLIESCDSHPWKKRKWDLAQHQHGTSTKLAMDGGNKLEIDELTQDFAYWDGLGIKSSSANLAAVYFTIAAILQNLRERDPEHHEDSLQIQIHQPVVLDPNNFVRFNDPIIQCCIWRAALDGEMDYRRSPTLSSAMCQIIVRTIDEMKHGRSSAAVDFLIGICMGKIQLVPSDRKVVRGHIGQTNRLVRYLNRIYPLL